MISVIRQMFSKWTKSNTPECFTHDRDKSWQLNGERHRTAAEFQKAAKLSNEDMLTLVLKYGEVEWANLQ